MATVFVNGKFCCQAVTGVQRVAQQLVLALDRRLHRQPDGRRWVLLTPPGALPLPLQHIEQQSIGLAGAPLHLWEQVWLPCRARRGLLLNLAGSAPAMAAAQVCMLHDAAVFDHPAAYTRLFGAWYRGLFRRLARRARRLLTVSEFSRQRLLAWLPTPRQDIVVVPNGCDHLAAVQPDPALLQRLGLAGQAFLLAVASANPNKNLPGLIAAFRRLPAPARLVLVGGSDPKVFAAGVPLGQAPGLVLTGRVSDAELKALYQHAAALMLPSFHEGFGLPALEAMSCGCPVAVARVAALPEVCGDGAAYFDPASEADMAAVMATLLNNPMLRDDLRRRAAAWLPGRDWETAAARLLDALGPAGP